MKTLVLISILALMIQGQLIPPPPPPPPPPPSPPVRVSGEIPRTGDGMIEVVVKRPDNGEPVGEAQVTVRGAPGLNGAVPQLNSITDSSGRSVFRNIPAGIYSVFARRANYWGPASISNIQGQPTTSTVVMIDAAQKNANITLHLTPGGAIRGIVRGSDGTLAPNVPLSVFRLTYLAGRRTLEKVRTERSDEHGQYRFSNLPPGEFYVRADGASSSNATAYYPGVLDPDSAAPIRVRGADEPIADFQMLSTPVFRISGTVVNTIPELAEDPTAFILMPRDLSRLDERNPTGWLANQTPGTQAGRFEVLVSRTGVYDLMPVAFAKREPGPGFDRQTYTGRVTVDVRDRDIDGLRVTISRGADLEIRVIPGLVPPGMVAGLQFVLRPLDSFGTILHQQVQPLSAVNGSVKFLNMPEGKYSLIVEGRLGLPLGSIPSGFYIRDVRQAGRSLINDGVISVGAGVADPVEVLLEAGGGEVNVAVEGAESIPDATLRVSLVPQGSWNGNPMLYRRGFVTDSRVRFADVPPGEYRLYAWEDLPEGADENAEFIARYEQQGRPVSVRTGAPVSEIKVPLVSASP